VLANGSLSTNTSGEGQIRQAIVEADLVDCIVSLPGQLFLSTQIPVSLWFLARNKTNGFGQEGRPLRDRSGDILFIDARNLGEMEDRTHKILTDADIAKITGTYHAWRGDGSTSYEDVPGFCKAATVDDVRGHGHVLTPGRYVGVAMADVDGEPFDRKLDRLTGQLTRQFAESAKLETAIRANLAALATNQDSPGDIA
jgi:type I restriction enzyme M protein